MLFKCKDITRIKKPYSKSIHKEKKKHGRIETRIVCVYHKDTYDLGNTWNESLHTIIKVERKTLVHNAKTKQYEQRGEIAYYVSTIRNIKAKKFCDIIRSHWGIENINHYVKDVTLGEDFSRIRKNPEVMASLRSFGLNLMRINNENNISTATYRNAVNVRRVLGYVGVRG